jgi:hypothetical protein
MFWFGDTVVSGVVLVGAGVLVGTTVTVGAGVRVVIGVFVGLGLTFPFATLQAAKTNSRTATHRTYVMIFFISIPPQFFLRFYYL